MGFGDLFPPTSLLVTQIKELHEAACNYRHPILKAASLVSLWVMPARSISSPWAARLDQTSFFWVAVKELKK